MTGYLRIDYGYLYFPVLICGDSESAGSIVSGGEYMDQNIFRVVFLVDLFKKTVLRYGELFFLRCLSGSVFSTGLIKTNFLTGK
jgi:hypothetical protein